MNNISHKPKEDKLKKILNSEIFLIIKDFLIIIFIVVFIRVYIAMPFQIKWSSMYPSYYNQEFIIVDRFSYNFWQPKRWDVIVFRPYINSDKEFFLKRIIWIPWDTLKIEKWFVYIKGKWENDFVKLEENYLNEENKWKTFVGFSDWSHIYELKDDQYFVIWDNRNHSTDSREKFWWWYDRDEFVKKEDIIWKVFFDLWYFNFSKFKFINGDWVESFPKFFSTHSTHKYNELN